MAPESTNVAPTMIATPAINWPIQSLVKKLVNGTDNNRKPKTIRIMRSRLPTLESMSIPSPKSYSL